MRSRPSWLGWTSGGVFLLAFALLAGIPFLLPPHLARILAFLFVAIGVSIGGILFRRQGSSGWSAVLHEVFLFLLATCSFLSAASLGLRIPEFRMTVQHLAAGISSTSGPDEVGFGWVLFLAAIVFGILTVRKVRSSSSLKWNWSLLAALTLPGLLAFFCFIPPKEQDRWGEQAKVYFLAGTDATLETAVKGVYGPQLSKLPRFGSLFEFLRLSGVSPEVVSTPLNSSVLVTPGVLVVLNLDRSLDPKELSAVGQFLKQGGSVLVLCDHTGVGGQLEPVNKLLDGSGIRLRFDSAIPFHSEWRWDGKLEATIHPLNRGLDPSDGLLWSIGASLDVESPAVPLLIGRDCFSDPGNKENRAGAFLGNMKWDPGEYRGELVLAAAEKVGAGWLVVLGDTSSLQDSSLPANHPWLSRFFHRLLAPQLERPKIFSLVPAIALAFLLGSLAIQGRLLFLFLAAGTILGASISRVWNDVRAASQIPLQPAMRSVVYLDSKHPGKFSFRSGKEDSPFGFYLALQRSGLIPLHLPASLEERLGSRPAALILWSPLVAYGESELSAIDRYLRDGGTVWVFCDPNHGPILGQLWKRYGISLNSQPLGNCDEARCLLTNEPIRPVEAWPLSVENAEPVASCWGSALAASRQVGQGRLVVFTDHRCFLGGNLENLDRADLWNVRYLEACIESLIH